MKTRRKFYLQIVWGAVFILLSGAWAGPSLAVEKTLSTDELLVYTLTELQDRMQSIVESNNTFVEKNNALRKRISLLRQEIRKLENDKLSLLDTRAGLTEDVKLDGKEDALATNKKELARRQRDHLKEQQGRLEAQMADEKARQKEFQNNMEALQEEIEGLQKQGGAGEDRFIKQQWKKEIAASSQLLKEIQSQINRFEKDVLALKAAMVNPQKQKGELQERQAILLRRAGEANEALQSQAVTERILTDDARRLREARQEFLEKKNNEISQWRMYRDALAGAMRELTEAQSAISAGFVQDKRDLIRLKDLLSRQNERLSQKKEVMGKTLILTKNFKEELESGSSLPAGSRNLSEQQLQLKNEGKTIRQKISQAREQEQSFAEKEKALNQEIRRLEAEIKALQKKPVGAKKAAQDKDEEANLSKALEDQARTNKALQKDAGVLQQGLTASRQELQRLQQEQNDLQKSLSSAAEKAKDLLTEETAPKPEEMVPQEAGQNDQEVLEEIEALRVRKEVLSSSVTTVEKEYDAADLSARNVVRDDRGFKEYLSGLQEENAGLKERLLSLMVELEELEAKKQGLETPKPEDQ